MFTDHNSTSSGQLVHSPIYLFIYFDVEENRQGQVILVEGMLKLFPQED